MVTERPTEGLFFKIPVSHRKARKHFLRIRWIFTDGWKSWDFA